MGQRSKSSKENNSSQRTFSFEAASLVVNADVVCGFAEAAIAINEMRSGELAKIFLIAFCLGRRMSLGSFYRSQSTSSVATSLFEPSVSSLSSIGSFYATQSKSPPDATTSCGASTSRPFEFTHKSGSKPCLSEAEELGLKQVCSVRFSASSASFFMLVAFSFFRTLPHVWLVDGQLVLIGF